MAIPNRVVITGIGVLSGSATGVDALWDRLTMADPEPNSRFITGFQPRDWMDRRQAQRTDRFAQIAIAAARLCQDDAGDPAIDAERTSVIVATGNGGLATIVSESVAFAHQGPSGVTVLQGVKMMTNASAASIAFALGITGEVFGVAGGCASGTHAVVEAARHIQLGVSDVVYTGGSDASITTDDPHDQAYPLSLIQLRVHTEDIVTRPFDVRRSGFVLHEGAAVLRLESLASAQARGAHIYAEVLAGANTVDGHDLITPAPRGAGLQRAIRATLAQAGVEPAEVLQVNVHGTGTQSNDEAENDAIVDVFGAPGPAVTSTKGTTGHAGAAAGAIEAAITAVSIDRRQIPPTHWIEDLDPAITVDVVRDTARPWNPGLALSTSVGLGGQNGAILLGPAPAPDPA